MPNLVICDTSTLILLSRIDQLILLKKVYTKVRTTPEIAEEYKEELPDQYSGRKHDPNLFSTLRPVIKKQPA